MEIDQSHLVREPFQVAYALERGDESYVDVPVPTEIEPGLWFGGAPEPLAPEGFDFIANLAAPWARYDQNGIECVNVTVEDGEATAEVAALFRDLAHEVNRRRDLGQTVLVHCQVGLNRSATVVALAPCCVAWRRPARSDSFGRSATALLFAIRTSSAGCSTARRSLADRLPAKARGENGSS